MHDDSARELNLVGAWSLVVADAARAGMEAVVGAGGAAPAALVTISAFPGQSMDQLRGTLALSQPGTLRLVERLTAQGLVERREVQGARGAGLVVTARGRRTVKRLLGEREQAMETLLGALSSNERQQLAALVEKALWTRAADGRDPRHVCRVCDRGACERCPVDLASSEAE
jgi:MarR family transcriptional regulator, negative regulator of the multidrug operon emrRAB